MIRTPVIERVMRRVEKQPDGCWLWRGAPDRHGYGQVNLGQYEGRALTHRVVYEHHNGPVPDGLELDHLCRVTACCNPEHLEPVTHAENIRRGEWEARKVAWFRSRTHCRNGHPYDDANTHIRPDGRRRCRACSAAWAREQRKASA